MKRYRKGEILTAKTINKLIDAARANTPTEGIGTRIVRGGSGGFTVHTVQPSRKPIPTASANKFPWKVTLKTKDEVTTATIGKGKVFEELLDDSEITPTLTEGEVEGGDLIVLQHTESATGAVGPVSTSITSTYEGVSSDGKTVSIIIAKIIADDDDKLSVDQVARNHFALTEICKNGELVRYFLAQ